MKKIAGFTILILLFAHLSFAQTHVYKDNANLVSLWHFESSGADVGDDDATYGSGNDLTQNSGDSGPVRVAKGAGGCPLGSYAVDIEEDDSEYLSIVDGSQTGLDPAGNFSIVFWAKPETENYGCVVGKGASVGNDRAYKIEEYTNDEVYFNISDDGTNSVDCYTAADQFAAGTYVHIGAVYNGTDMRVYVNGSLASNGENNPLTYSSGTNDSGEPFMIGNVSSGSDHFDGIVDEAAFFSDALSADEVSGIYTYGIEDPATDSGQVIIIISKVQRFLKGIKRAWQFGILDKYLVACFWSLF